MIHLTQPLHHAYGVPGSADTLIPQILKALEEFAGFIAKGNPDFRAERYEVLGIDEARALKEAAERTAVTGGKKVCIVSAQGMTREAQNALLKILEEPPPETYFFLIVPALELLLPTFRSRLLVLRASDSRRENQMLAELPSVKEFLAKPLPARITVVQAMLKELADEKDDAADSNAPLLVKERIFAFLSSLESELARDTQKNAEALSELLKAKAYSRDRAPSFKLLLEHLALVLPQMK